MQYCDDVWRQWCPLNMCECYKPAQDIYFHGLGYPQVSPGVLVPHPHALPISSHQNKGVDGHIGCHVDEILDLFEILKPYMFKFGPGVSGKGKVCNKTKIEDRRVWGSDDMRTNDTLPCDTKGDRRANTCKKSHLVFGRRRITRPLIVNNNHFTEFSLAKLARPINLFSYAGSLSIYTVK